MAAFLFCQVAAQVFFATSDATTSPRERPQSVRQLRARLVCFFADAFY
jgi:hypothetical protein